MSSMSKEDVVDVIAMDHCYTKAWSAYPDATHVKPVCKLFMSKAAGDGRPVISLTSHDVDVTTVDHNISGHIYDVSKAQMLMTECQRNVNFARVEEVPEEWEDRISRTGWTLQQSRLFNRVTKALQSNRLARLAYEGNSNEPVMRRLYIDKAAKRIRQALAAVSWETSIIQWLHNLLVDNVNQSTLVAYLNVLQTLRAKVPDLVDKMMVPTYKKVDGTSAEALNLLLKRPWDPLTSYSALNKPKKLPGSPLFVVIPSGLPDSSTAATSRKKNWNSQLTSFGKVIPISVPYLMEESERFISTYKHLLLDATHSKVTELKHQCYVTGKPLVLIGWDVGALIACQIAATEPVTAVVCLGFPVLGIDGTRGDVQDPILDNKVPTLFVIGQHANTCTVDDLEDVRERLKQETSLIVVGGADDALRMSHSRKKIEGLTQSMVDKIIQDKIAEFLTGVLAPPPLASESSCSSDVSSRGSAKKRKAQLGMASDRSGFDKSSLSQSVDSRLYTASYSQSLQEQRKSALKKTSPKNDKSAPKRTKLKTPSTAVIFPATTATSNTSAVYQYAEMARAAFSQSSATVTHHAPIASDSTTASTNFSHITKALANAGFAQARLNLNSSAAVALSANFFQTRQAFPKLNYAHLMEAAAAAAMAASAAAVTAQRAGTGGEFHTSS